MSVARSGVVCKVVVSLSVLCNYMYVKTDLSVSVSSHVSQTALKTLESRTLKSLKARRASKGLGAIENLNGSTQLVLPQDWQNTLSDFGL